MPMQSYPAARAVAPALHEHFARHIAAARGSLSASLPDQAAIESIIDTGFWASLRREEGYVPRISFAYLSPEQTPHPLVFEHALPLEPAAMTRVAPAVERPGIHLGVWPDGDRLCVWGTARTVPTFCFVLEVVAPGLLVVKHHRGDEQVKYTNVAVLEGDRVKIVDEHASAIPDCPPLLTSLLGFDSPSSWGRPVNVLVQLAVSMRAHRRGGSLLVVPAATERWRESIVQPIRYAVRAFTELVQAASRIADALPTRETLETLDRTIEEIAGLTAVDGATVMTDRYELLAFGVKIGRRDGMPQVDRIALTEPVEGSLATVLDPSELGGTRHLSAAQFVHDQRDAVALVASQDGHFTIFAWSPCEDMVHAHRVETLLL